MSVIKTRIIYILENNNIPFRIISYSKPIYTVESAKKQQDIKKDEILKSILLCDKDGRYVMTCVIGDARLDTKAVRSQLPKHWKRLHFARAEEIFKITGCVKGSVSPIGLPNNLPVIIDELITYCSKINIGSGNLMYGLTLKTKYLLNFIKPIIADIKENKNTNIKK